MHLQRWLAATALGGGLLVPVVAPRAEDMSVGAEIVARMNARDDGSSVTRTLHMELIDKDGTTRTRVLRSYRRQVESERRALLFFDAPPAVKGTAFLSWDYAEPERSDDQWLYLPELRKTRRIALAERGRAFLGTDLSFEDMKKETKVEPSDYRWQAVGEETIDGHRCWLVEGVVVDQGTARETGYGRVLLRVDAQLSIPRFLEYWDPGGVPLKTIRLLDIEAIDGIYTPRRIEATNLQTGHRTQVRFERIDHRAEIPADLLTEASLRHGAP